MTSDAQADVFVTNPLPTSVHIITCDFLIHSSPALLSISTKELHLNMSVNDELIARARMVMYPIILSGGSFVVEIRIGAEPFRCTVDTGAPGPVCLSAGAAKRIPTCVNNSEKRVLRQTGVNGEQVCSEIIAADVKFCNRTFSKIPIFVNDTDIDQVDGYIGLGMLRAFDMLFTPTGIGFMVNGMPMRDIEIYKESAAVGTCPNINLTCSS